MSDGGDVGAMFEGRRQWYDLVEWDVSHEDVDGGGWVVLSIGLPTGTFNLKFTVEDADRFLEEFREHTMLAKAIDWKHCDEESEA